MGTRLTRCLFLLAASWQTAAVSIIKERSEERRVGKECRSRCDWSSDVCSSDLYNKNTKGMIYGYKVDPLLVPVGSILANGGSINNKGKIGRASCRERV